MTFKKFRFSSLSILFAAAFLFALPINLSAQNSAPESDGDARLVRNEFERLIRAFNRRDAKTLVSMLAADVLLVSTRHPDADYKTLSEGFPGIYSAPAPYTIFANIEEIQTSGDLAFVRAIWRRERNSDKKIISKEKDVEIWQRQKDGKWKLARGYSYNFTEELPLTPVSALAKSEAASGKTKMKPPKSNAPEDLAAVKKQLERLVASYNKRDLEQAMSVYAPDSLLSHDGVADMTSEQSRQGYARRFANPPPFPITISYQTEEIQTSGDLAFARLIWIVERGTDKKILSRNKDLEIWQRQNDGSWKLFRGTGFYLKPETAGGAGSAGRGTQTD